MPDVHKTTAPGAARGVIYDLAAARARASAASSEGADSAGFTGRGRELARADAAVRESPEARAEKVRALRAQVQAGEYRPDPREIARNILAHGL